jgi:hypothetical protein
MSNTPAPGTFLLFGAIAVFVGALGRIFPPLMKIGWWSAKWDENDRAWALVFLGVVFFGAEAWRFFSSLH